jgi:hypothetical protein
MAYGASRLQRSTGLAAADEKRENDRVRSLFQPDFELSNPEEWLLHLDYLATRNSERASDRAEERDRVRDILIEILPDVDDIQFAEDEVGLRFRRPYG